MTSEKKPRKLTTQEVADEYRSHIITVRISLNAGKLHGKQRTKGGNWLIEEGCAEAWAGGELCEHKKAEAEESRGKIPLLRAS